MERKDYSDTTIIIPTFNEGENISELLKLIEKLYKNISIIISDDGSTDKTQEIIRKYSKKNKKIKLFDRSRKTVHGLTASVVDASKKVKTKYIVVMDGDLQHPPEKIKDIIKELRKGKDIVAGARKKVFDWSLDRRTISKGATLLGKARLLLKGAICNDILSGFFGIKTELIQNINKNKFELKGYKVLFDILKNIDKNTKIKNIYYDFGMRKRGHSKIGLKQVISFLKALFS
ncbi:MAG TPA: glycosyltransferase [Candidatus Woesearchaeota archaeon]|nr:glycosyltransferase [Candidatus Woesearchaeota archaeon]